MDWKRTVIAYEPIAISTAKRTISIESVEEVCEQIRKWFQDTVSPETAEALRIVYAGAVNESNCKLYIMQKNIDGLLVS